MCLESFLCFQNLKNSLKYSRYKLHFQNNCLDYCEDSAHSGLDKKQANKTTGQFLLVCIFLLSVSEMFIIFWLNPYSVIHTCYLILSSFVSRECCSSLPFTSLVLFTTDLLLFVSKIALIQALLCMKHIHIYIFFPKQFSFYQSLSFYSLTSCTLVFLLVT